MPQPVQQHQRPLDLTYQKPKCRRTPFPSRTASPSTFETLQNRIDGHLRKSSGLRQASEPALTVRLALFPVAAAPLAVDPLFRHEIEGPKHPTVQATVASQPGLDCGAQFRRLASRKPGQKGSAGTWASPDPKASSPRPSIAPETPASVSRGNSLSQHRQRLFNQLGNLESRFNQPPAACTIETSKGQDSANAAELSECRPALNTFPKASRSGLYQYAAGTTKPEANMAQLSVLQDSYHRPYTDPSLRAPPPHAVLEPRARPALWSPSPHPTTTSASISDPLTWPGQYLPVHSSTRIGSQTTLPKTPLPARSRSYTPRLEKSGMSDTAKPSSRKDELVGKKMSTDIASIDAVAVDMCGPCSTPETDDCSEDESYETPLTSPCSSPPKMRPRMPKFPPFGLELAFFDGGNDHTKCSLEIDDPFLDAKDADSNLADETSTFSSDAKREAAEHEHRHGNDAEDCAASTDNERDDITPLVPASPAKPPPGFPFPAQSHCQKFSINHSRTRRPSALLTHCERNATPRQRRLMAEGVNTLDRFIPSRAATPIKDRLLVPSPVRSIRAFGLSSSPSSPPEDPFASARTEGLGWAEHYATIRHSPSQRQPVGMRASRVTGPPQMRAASTGAVWTVGGSVVTEGVASVTNGRGGRVTSGTCAPHYTADLLKKMTPSDEEVRHGKRVAVALDLSPGARMMDQGVSPVKGADGVRVWRNGRWEMVDGVTPTKAQTKREKGIPTIPFRVLDAPSLRDDYYCSLLAYSQTADCLAVGLGAHVYLWSESRGKSKLPDSLAAPPGTAHVTSISFSSYDGGSAILAIGRADGRITLWSPQDRDPRFDSEQPAPVSCLAFRPRTVQRRSTRDQVALVPTEELLVGDELGCVYLYAIEWPSQNQRDLFDWHGSMTLLARMTCHSQQICGIAWSPDGDFFATGGNDNQLFLFESKRVLQRPPVTQPPSTPTVQVRTRNSSGTDPPTSVSGAQSGEVLSITPGQQRHIFTLNAAVKAIAFAPWQPTLLAAGGGSNDRCVHFFHTLSGATLATIDCHAQVTSLTWSSAKKEIAATFGFAQPEHPYRVAVFTWPACGMVVGIPWWGEERALFAVSYPRGPSSRHIRRRERKRGSREGREMGGNADPEGQAWYGRRTRKEGCLVVATSDASIKFHEIWSEKTPRRGGQGEMNGGVLGGSQILEGECSREVEALGIIR